MAWCFFNIGGLEAKSGGLELTQSMAKLYYINLLGIPYLI